MNKNFEAYSSVKDPEPPKLVSVERWGISDSEFDDNGKSKGEEEVKSESQRAPEPTPTLKSTFKPKPKPTESPRYAHPGSDDSEDTDFKEPPLTKQEKEDHNLDVVDFDVDDPKYYE